MLSHSSLVVLWIYIVLLLAGGVMGLVKGKSKISLIMSIIFAVPLVFCAMGYLASTIAEVVIGILGVFFGIRFVRGKKFMPAGLMTILSIAALLALMLLH